MARSLPVENLVGSIINYLQQLLKQPNGELLVASADFVHCVNYLKPYDIRNLLRTMASETVEPFDWAVLPPSWAVPPELHVLHGVNGPTNRKACCTNRDSNARPRVCQINAVPVRPLRVSGLIDYYCIIIYQSCCQVEIKHKL